MDELKLLPEVEKKNIHSIAYLTFLESDLLTPEAKIVWLHLDARAGTNRYLWFEKAKIFNSIGFKRDKYLKLINELEIAVAIRQYERYDKSNGKRYANIVLVNKFDYKNNIFIVPENIHDIELLMANEYSDSIIKINNAKPLKLKKYNDIKTLVKKIKTKIIIDTQKNKKIRKHIFDKYNGRCAYCGKEIEFKINEFHIDHIIPKSKGGTERIENKALSCPKCNIIKSNKTLEEFGHIPNIFPKVVK